MLMTSISASYNSIKRPAFCGITRQFEKEVFAMPYSRAKRLITSVDKDYFIVGYFPADILTILKNNSTSKEELSSKIVKFNNCLSNLSKNIRSFDKMLLKQIETINIEDYLYDVIYKSAKYKSLSVIGYIKTPLKFKLSHEEKNNILNNSVAESVMKDIGLIPQDGKLKFTFEGEGSYKNCFKMQFLDKDGNDIVHPKAYVIEKRANLGPRCNKILNNKIDQYIEKTKYKDFFINMSNRIENDESLSPELKEYAKSEISLVYRGKYNTAYIYSGPAIVDESFDINGIFPEANAALKIRKDLNGNYVNSNMIQAYLFDLRNKFGLLEFADNNLPESKIQYDFDKYDLHWLDKRSSNYMLYNSNKQKIIDYGSIVPKSKNFSYITSADIY